VRKAGVGKNKKEKKKRQSVHKGQPQAGLGKTHGCHERFRTDEVERADGKRVRSMIEMAERGRKCTETGSGTFCFWRSTANLRPCLSENVETHMLTGFLEVRAKNLISKTQNRRERGLLRQKKHKGRTSTVFYFFVLKELEFGGRRQTILLCPVRGWVMACRRGSGVFKRSTGVAGPTTEIKSVSSRQLIK